MNAASFVRFFASLLAAPILLFALTAAAPQHADAAAPAKNAPGAKSSRHSASNRKAGNQKNNSSLHKHTKKHHKHKKHHHRHHKHGKHGKTASNGQSGRNQAINQDLSRVSRDEGALNHDMNQLRRALR